MGKSKHEKKHKDKKHKKAKRSSAESTRSIVQPDIKDEEVSLDEEGKNIVKFTYKRRQTKRGQFIVCHDAEDIIEFDPSKVTSNPSTIYETASNIFNRLNMLKTQIGNINSKAQELIRSLDQFTRA